MSDLHPNHFNSGLTPSEAARAVLELSPVLPVSTIQYRSQGRLLVVGHPDAIDGLIERIPRLPQVYAGILDSCTPRLSLTLARHDIPFLDRVIDLQITGWLSCFRARATRDGHPVRLDEYFGLTGTGFDLVLDLCEPTRAKSPVAPIGYFAVGHSDRRKLSEALAELPQCLGELNKPKYVYLRLEQCAHKSGGTETCRLCIEVCGTWAISAEAGEITINPYLCQGCGDCTMVCPTGAFRYDYPSSGQTLLRLFRLLEAYRQRGGKVPVLLLHDATRGREWLSCHRSRLPINVLPYEIEALCAVGVDTWLMALAFGATEILMLDSGEMNAKSRALLQHQVAWAQALLEGMGYPSLCLRTVHVDELTRADLPVHAFCPIASISTWSQVDDKRTHTREAVEHLRHRSIAPSFAALPDGAPFGAVRIDATACTLCQDCVAVCPERALLADETTRDLAFIEANCIQCGACGNACPESAITLEPRYLYDRKAAINPRLMVQRESPRSTE